MGAQQEGPVVETADISTAITNGHSPVDTSVTAVTDLMAGSSIQDTPSNTTPITPTIPTTFHRFPDLPTELRLKIWYLSFEPRVVEIHRRKSHYADAYHTAATSRGSPLAKQSASLAMWQSWSANPPALAVSYEARSCALWHYSATIRLAVNTPCERAGEAHLDMYRRLYLAPHTDTLAMLGEFNVAQTNELLRHIKGQVPGRCGGRRCLRRLALCASSIGHPGSGILLLIYGRNIFAELDQLTLFLYDERMPPATWTDGHLALVDCRDTYTFRRFQVGQGAELRDQSKNQAMGGGSGTSTGWMKVGRNPLDVLDLAFGRDAEAVSANVGGTPPVTPPAVEMVGFHHSSSVVDKPSPQVTTMPIQSGKLEESERRVPVAP